MDVAQSPLWDIPVGIARTHGARKGFLPPYRLKREVILNRLRQYGSCCSSCRRGSKTNDPHQRRKGLPAHSAFFSGSAFSCRNHTVPSALPISHRQQDRWIQHPAHCTDCTADPVDRCRGISCSYPGSILRDCIPRFR